MHTNTEHTSGVGIEIHREKKQPLEQINRHCLSSWSLLLLLASFELIFCVLFLCVFAFATYCYNS